jgi:hypothetical protein
MSTPVTGFVSTTGEMAERYGAEVTVADWHARLVCAGCGSRQIDFVATGTERR